MTADSLAWLEFHQAWRLTRPNLLEMPARQAEALLVIEGEWRKENQRGEE